MEDAEYSLYLEFCRDNDYDPDDENALDEWRNSHSDPYKHYGVRRSDF